MWPCGIHVLELGIMRARRIVVQAISDLGDLLHMAAPWKDDRFKKRFADAANEVSTQRTPEKNAPRRQDLLDWAAELKSRTCVRKVERDTKGNPIPRKSERKSHKHTSDAHEKKVYQRLLTLNALNLDGR